MVLYRIRVFGIVQGVGFRPFISRLAKEQNIFGTVCNKGSYVEIFAQGEKKILDQFQQDILDRAPERSDIVSLEKVERSSSHVFGSFDIIDSEKETGAIFISPDIATCETCRNELFDSSNRRYLHPFINCTACGPRLTILESMPYDRERTSMKDFPMCHACHVEYTSPDTRRYDAQPICCNACGPEVYLVGEPCIRGAAAITRARKAIKNGSIIAIKGIGGFHLCCDAYDEIAVKRLRERKSRPVKPFAVMMRNMDIVHNQCIFEHKKQEKILTGHQKPILLLRKKKHFQLASSVAPGNPKIGVMLPYAPIQMLLFDYPDGIEMPDSLIMTSGNPSGAPICHTDEEASDMLLGKICDLILSNNRRIRLRADDSVMDWLHDKPYMIRRSRGYTPLPFSLNQTLHGQVLAIGGELKNTFAIVRDNLIYPSPYIGDMSDLRTLTALKDSVLLFESLFECTPSLIACDLHPRYNTTAYAKTLNTPLFPIQHHYAHILSCMAENQYSDPVIGISFDGTGYGTDETIWGGEILQADYHGFLRLGSIEPFWQFGGDAAAREGWRVAVSMLYHLCATAEEARTYAKSLNLCSDQEWKTQSILLENNLNGIISTSAGRLFDAISALLGIRRKSTFEGEASMFLQFAAEEGELMEADSSLPLIPLKKESKTGRFFLPTFEMFYAALQECIAGIDVRLSAYYFHIRLADSISNACNQIKEKTGICTVALSGGVFQNLFLVRLIESRLMSNGFHVLTHSLIPPNDGGLCLGQATAAIVHLNEE